MGRERDSFLNNSLFGVLYYWGRNLAIGKILIKQPQKSRQISLTFPNITQHTSGKGITRERAVKFWIFSIQLKSEWATYTHPNLQSKSKEKRIEYSNKIILYVRFKPQLFNIQTVYTRGVKFPCTNQASYRVATTDEKKDFEDTLQVFFTKHPADEPKFQCFSDHASQYNLSNKPT